MLGRRYPCQQHNGVAGLETVEYEGLAQVCRPNTAHADLHEYSSAMPASLTLCPP